MKRDISLWQLVGFAWTSLAGTVLHFWYDLSGSTFSALFSGVNESTWEHMKLLFFPMFLFAVVQSFFFANEYQSFWCIKLKGTLLGLLLIPVIFYTLRGIFGITPDWINITIFFVSAAAAYIYEAKQLKKGCVPCKYKSLAIIALCIIAIFFLVFTFIPPALPLFQDPINGSFGLYN